MRLWHWQHNIIRAYHPLIIWACLVMIILLYPFVDVGPVTAQTERDEPAVVITDFQQQDLNEDNQPDVVFIDTVMSLLQAQEDSEDLEDPIITEAVRISIYDGGNDMVWGEDWVETTDFTNDIWVFDTYNDGTAQLILAFARNINTDESQAYLYIDQDNDTIVDYEIAGTDIEVTEGQGWPAVTFSADGEWFLPDGDLNWNVRISTDGPVTYLATFDLTHLWHAIEAIEHDGNEDVVVEFEDSNRDGIPEYGIWRLLTDVPTGYGFIRTWIWSNEGLYRPAQPENILFWPYLRTLGLTEVRNYFDVPPFLVGDLSAGSIQRLDFPGYPIEQGFHVHTFEYFREDQVNYANFENVQAYYDLANNRNHVPELHIRHRYFGAYDPYAWDLNTPINEIRWSWNQSLDGDERHAEWDYKLGLAGRHEIIDEDQVGDFAYTTIPYENLPEWVMEQDWDYITFVALESIHPYLSTEGVYEWAAVESTVDGDPEGPSQYLAGTNDINLLEVFQSIRRDMRGEIAPYVADQPWLYFSPIDRKLHLLKARSGIWNLDEHMALYYDNLDSDPYLDQWIYVEVVDSAQPYVVTRQLNVTDTHLIYADEEQEQVFIQESQISPSLFETLPPANHAEWKKLGTQLERHERAFEPGDLRAMVEQFSGATTEFDKATLRDFRFTDMGYRFVIDVQEGYQVSGVDAAVFANLQPGEYVISHTNTFHVEALTNPEFSLELHLRNQNAELQRVEPRAIEVTNTGLEDAYGLHLRAEVRKGTMETDVISQTVTVYGDASQWLPLEWQPTESGNWEVKAWLEDHDGLVVAQTQQTINTARWEEEGIQTIVEVSSRDEVWWKSPLLLLALAVAMIVAVSMALAGNATESEGG